MGDGLRDVRTAQTMPDGVVEIVGVLPGGEVEGVGRIDTLTAMGFTGEHGETIAVTGEDGRRRVLVGLGDDVDVDRLRTAAGAAARAVPGDTTVGTELHHLDLDGAAEAVVTGLLLGSYRFDEFKSSPAEGEAGDVVLVGAAPPGEVEHARALARAVTRARDWVNRPPSVQAPAVLADDMADRLRSVGYDVEVWGPDRIEAERLGGLRGVAAGSDRPPRMLVAHRRAGAERRLALVGKGIVFDSGGLSIKSTANMETMKGDMAGAAAVVAAAEAIGALGVEIDASVWVPLTDNMPGGSAIKPGDVLTARNGKTIEVLNTDAEGRLVLADALSLAAEEEPDLVVDVATLTGAARVALGNLIAAMWASDDETAERVSASAERAGERLWRMPLPPDYRSLIDSKVADMKNTGGRHGGAIAAALLLSEFAGDGPWAHLDIAGPSWFHEGGPLGPVGGSGFGVPTLVTLAEQLAAP